MCIALAGYILRFCAKCGTSTEWRQAANAIRWASSPAAPMSPSLFSLRAEPEPTRDRRRYRARARGSLVLPVASNSYSGAPPELINASASAFGAHDPVQVAMRKRRSREALPPAATAVVARTANRRRDVRTRVSFTACIRQESSSEEIVECDNISKGGLSFRSRKNLCRGIFDRSRGALFAGSPGDFRWRLHPARRNDRFWHVVSLRRRLHAQESSVIRNCCNAGFEPHSAAAAPRALAAIWYSFLTYA